MEMRYQKDFQFQHPFAMTIIGSRRTGKTNFVKNLLISRDKHFNSEIDDIYWFSPGYNEVFDELEENIPNIKLIKGLPSNISALLSDKSRKTLFVIDDLISQAGKRVDVSDMFTNGRHSNLSVILLTQNMYHKGRHFRDMSINSDYFVIFKNIRDTTSLRHLGMQMNNLEFLTEVFDDIAEKPFSHVVIDFRADTPKHLRFRSNIFGENGEHPILYKNINQNNKKMKYSDK